LPIFSNNLVVNSNMIKIVRTFLSLIIVLTCMISSSCSQPDDLVYLNKETAIDVDGNIYHTVTINGQVWMTENLKTTHYRNGDLINAGPINKDDNEFFDLSKEFEPKYQWPCNGQENLVPVYGRLYTWYAATDNRNLCPNGWHLPTDKEWEALRTFLIKNNYGRFDKNGNRKEASAIGIALASDSLWYGSPLSTSWDDDLIGTNFTEHNTTGFSALPAGCFFGDFVTPGYIAIWRSTSPKNAWGLEYLSTSLDSGFFDIPWTDWHSVWLDPSDGYSIRCVKDGSKPGQNGDTTLNSFVQLTLSYPNVLYSKSATFDLYFNSDGGAQILDKGICWSTSPEPNILLSTKVSYGSGKNMFSARISGLSTLTTYYVRAYATTSAGTTYSNERRITTTAIEIKMSTINASSISNISATLGGTIINGDSLEITSKGVCWSTLPNPTIDLTTKTNDGSGSVDFISQITGLNLSTIYYARAYVVSSLGTTYGNEVQFKTKISEIIKDVDGNEYQYVNIGTQTWMVENLKTTKYRDGTPIPQIQESLDWLKLTTGAYSNYQNVPTNADTYGRLYNWYAVCDSRNIAPEGWHVATVVEWRTLISYLGGIDAAIYKLKETGTTHWRSPNTGATNEYKFTALPGGFCNENLNFMSIGVIGDWWGFTQDFSSTVCYLGLFDPNSDMNLAYTGIFNITTINYRRYGMSVRCVKDE